MKHAPNRFSRHVRILHANIQRLRSEGEFVGDDKLRAYQESRRGYILEGEIGCQGRIIVGVHKMLAVVRDAETDDPIVVTTDYIYQVRVEGGRQLFRYDNADHHPFPDRHHKHLFDDAGEERPDSPVWIGADKWPQVSDVVREAYLLYVLNFDRWPSHEFPTTLRDRLDMR